MSSNLLIVGKQGLKRSWITLNYLVFVLFGLFQVLDNTCGNRIDLNLSRCSISAFLLLSPPSIKTEGRFRTKGQKGTINNSRLVPDHYQKVIFWHTEGFDTPLWSQETYIFRKGSIIENSMLLHHTVIFLILKNNSSK